MRRFNSHVRPQSYQVKEGNHDKGRPHHWRCRTGRRVSSNTVRSEDIYWDPHYSDARFHLRNGDLTDSTNLIWLIQHIHPDEVSNLGVQPQRCKLRDGRLYGKC